MKHVYKDPGIHLIFTKTKNTPIVNVPHSNPGRFTHARQHTHNDADGQRNHCQFSQQVTMKVRFVFQHGLLSIKIYAATSHWRQASFSPEKWSNNSRRRCVQAPAIQHQLIYTGKTINKKGANSSPRSESSDQGRWVKPTAFHMTSSIITLIDDWNILPDSENLLRKAVEERREPTTPQTPSRLRQQASWLDDVTSSSVDRPSAVEVNIFSKFWLVKNLLDPVE